MHVYASNQDFNVNFELDGAFMKFVYLDHEFRD